MVPMPKNIAPNFFIRNFTIHSVEGASCVNIGSNRPIGFTSFKKHNQGFGSISGTHNTIDGIKTVLNDQSLFDMFQDSNIEDMAWVKEIKELVIAKVMDYLEDTDVEEDPENYLDELMEFLDEQDENHETLDDNEVDEPNEDI